MNTAERWHYNWWRAKEIFEKIESHNLFMNRCRRLIDEWWYEIANQFINILEEICFCYDNLDTDDFKVLEDYFLDLYDDIDYD